MTSLQEELDRIREADLEEDSRAAYEAFVRQLFKAESADRALKAGDAMPAFLLPSAEGRLISSDELLARGPLVVSFYRGDWCPYCRAMLDTLEAALPLLQAAGGQLVMLTPDAGGRPLATKRKHRLSYEILADIDSGVGLQFGIVFRAPEAYRKLLAESGIDLAERHGNGGWFIPIPATFVVDRGGIIRYAFVDSDFTRRAEPEAIIEVLRRL